MVEVQLQSDGEWVNAKVENPKFTSFDELAVKIIFDDPKSDYITSIPRHQIRRKPIGLGKVTRKRPTQRNKAT